MLNDLVTAIWLEALYRCWSDRMYNGTLLGDMVKNEADRRATFCGARLGLSAYNLTAETRIPTI